MTELSLPASSNFFSGFLLSLKSEVAYNDLPSIISHFLLPNECSYVLLVLKSNILNGFCGVVIFSAQCDI